MVLVTRECANCDVEFTRDVKPNRVLTTKFCSLQCSGSYNIALGIETNIEKGNRSGYYRERDGRREHLWVAEEILGRRLQPNEVVHHKDSNKRNNDPSNLEVHTKSTHASLHAKRADPIQAICGYCKIDFELSSFQRMMYNRGQRVFYCDRYCAGWSHEKKRERLILKCAWCKKEFEANNQQILKYQDGYRVMYCSIECGRHSSRS